MLSGISTGPASCSPASSSPSSELSLPAASPRPASCHSVNQPALSAASPGPACCHPVPQPVFSAASPRPASCNPSSKPVLFSFSLGHASCSPALQPIPCAVSFGPASCLSPSPPAFSWPVHDLSINQPSNPKAHSTSNPQQSPFLGTCLAFPEKSLIVVGALYLRCFRRRCQDSQVPGPSISSPAHAPVLVPVLILVLVLNLTSAPVPAPAPILGSTHTLAPGPDTPVQIHQLVIPTNTDAPAVQVGTSCGPLTALFLGGSTPPLPVLFLGGLTPPLQFLFSALLLVTTGSLVLILPFLSWSTPRMMPPLFRFQGRATAQPLSPL